MEFLTDIDKKIISVLLSLLVLISVVGCKDINDKKENLTEKIVTLEKNKSKLENLDITYNEYKENIKVVTTKDFLKSKIKDILFVIDGKQYTGSILIDLSKEETEKLKREIKEINKKMNLFIKSKKIEISDSYESEIPNTKYVFSKITETDESETESTTTKRYTFIKENDKWKIDNIDFDTISVPANNNQNKDKLVSNLKYQTKNNEKVEYIKEINLME